MRGAVGGGAVGPTHAAMTAVAVAARLVGEVDELLDESRLDVEVEHHQNGAHLLPRERPRLVLVEEAEAAADLKEGRGRERWAVLCAVMWAGGPDEAEGPRRTSLKRVLKCSRILPCAFRSSASLTGGPLILGAAAASLRACATFAASRRLRSAASLASFFA